MSTKIRIGINGFGRIGRTLFRLLNNHPTIEVVAVNDIADAKTLSHLLKYDSVHGIAPFSCSYTKTSLVIDGVEIPLYNTSKIEDLHWNGVDVVVEATGKFKALNHLEKHIKAGAKKVILSF